MIKESSKSRTIQSELLRMVEGFVDGSMPRPDKSSNEWNLVGGGHNIEDWEFTNEAIKSLLRKHYNDKGNPFTQVKIDSRSDMGKYLLEKDYVVIHTPKGHVFERGMSRHFGDFPTDNRLQFQSVQASRHLEIINSKLLQHAQGEGAFFGAAYFMESEQIESFLGVPKGISVAIIPSHRRSFGGIQSEIDSMLIWETEGHTHMAVFESKTSSINVPNWDSGFSFHQVRRSSFTVGARFDAVARKHVTITPVYFRIEWKRRSDKWTARLDRFEELKDLDSIPKVVASLDIIDLPR